MIPSPKELDLQCKVSISKWVDLYGQEIRDMDPDINLTIKWFKMLQGEYLFTDRDGRIFGRGNNGYWYPYHFTYGKKNIGYRLSSKAAN